MKTLTAPRLTLVVPCYNEEPMLPKSAPVLSAILHRLMDSNQIATDSKILFVDDGSRDHTWTIITQLRQADTLFTGLKFSRNFGQEAALMAGMQVAHPFSDLIITIDADLQDDPRVIGAMVQQAKEGFDIVYGVRNDRSTDTWFKRTTAEAFYWTMGKLGVELVPDHSDFRLLSHRAVTALMTYTESTPFIRGIIPKLGFPSTKLYYKRQPRAAGTSKYPLKRMLRFALSGIFSLSLAPLRAIMYLGFTICTAATIALLWLLGLHLNGLTTNGALLTSLWLLGGLQLIGLGVIGQYVGQILRETQHRPHFIIQTETFSTAFLAAPLTVTPHHEHQSVN
ncbi:glycosyltransferase-like protein [Levilactobacillus paucivorans]|uniref:Glycosyltransferase-like protein n=1 Tax=Levilactobacillus paucivorans TaxID=616990 RepID=A0A0R2LSR0_9LACO|nr:glycosyltransferase family 2 protein [Levilactobacillus paucivorans]KRO04609.1 glycosyltransferase-like protein [Levilactobacillus paucivorans]